MRPRTYHSRKNSTTVSPDQISGCTFYADMLDARTFVYSSGNVVEQMINKASLGTTFTENVVNGTFNSDVSSWLTQQCTNAWDATNGGSLKVTNTGAAAGFANQILTLIPGKQYRIKGAAVGAGTSTTCAITVRDNVGAVNIVTKTISASTGTFDFTFVAPSNAIQIRLTNNTVSGAFLYWDNISVIQIDSELQQTVGNQGTLVASGINGKNAIQFDGATTYYANAAKAVASQFTKFATIKHDFTSTNNCNIISSQTAADHAITVTRFSSVIERINCQQGNLTYDLTNLDAQNQYTIVETFNSNGAKTIWVNGAKVATGNTIKSIVDFSYFLGSVGTLAATSFFKGFIADHGTYNRVLDDGEIAALDEHQRRRWRVPSDSANYVAVAGIGQSNEVGLSQTQADVIASGSGLNYIPSINHYHDTNDPVGEGYSKASIGSSWPAFVNKFKALTGKKVVHVTCGKTGTSISTVASSNPSDRTLDWGAGSTLRSNFVANTLEMLSLFNKSKLDWIVINQGERDYSYMVTDPTWTKDTYKAAYLDLMNYCLTNFPGAKFLIVQSVQSRVTGTDAAQNTPQWQAVITAQQEIAASQPNTYLIQDTQTFTITNGNIESVDGVHYTKAGNVIVGESTATKISQNL